MKTISVKQAAEALGCSTRSVQYKLQNGDLKGIQSKNQYGVKEWRVWPTKEIAEKLSAKYGGDSTGSIDFAPEDRGAPTEAVEVEDVVYGTHEVDAEREKREQQERQAEEEKARERERQEAAEWQQLERERLDLERERLELEREKIERMAQALVKPLTEKISEQAIAMNEQQKIIEEQSRQLKLLPDFQKQADAERKAAELKELEAEALRKQIAAMEEIRERSEEAQRIAREEIQRLKDEKEAQVTAVQEQLRSLAATVQELKRPLWKKWFLPKP